MKKSEYYMKEISNKKYMSVAFFYVAGIAGFIILNVLITLTNRFDSYRNAVSISLVILFLIILFLLIERSLTVYVYMLSNDRIGFVKRVGNKESIILEVPFNTITDMKMVKFSEPNPKVTNTYYFINREVNEEDICGEFLSEGKTYRFVFSPSERILRILQKKFFIGVSVEID